MSVEEWRDIPDHEGYQVSSLGRVRGVDRYITRVRNGKTSSIFVRGRVLSLTINKDGYLRVGFGKRCNKHLVHRLMALAFLKPVPGKDMVCHKDGNRTNNVLPNIYWGDAADNAQDALRHGTHPLADPANNPSAKMTWKDVRYIRRAYRVRGVKQRVLAKRYGVTQATISRLINNHSWNKSHG